MHSRYLALLFGISFAFSLSAQRGWEVGGNLGVGYYFGDLNTEIDLGLPRPSGGLLGKFIFNKRTAVRMGLQYTMIEAKDARSSNSFEQIRNLSVRTHIGEFQGIFEYNFLPLVHGDDEFFWSPYLFAGASFLYFRPTAKYQDDWVHLQPLGTEGQPRGDEYLPFHGAIVYGFGFKFNLNRRWTLFTEINARAAFSDYLDDVSTTYTDNARLRLDRGDTAADLADRSLIIPGVNDSPIGVEGRQRGEARTMDQVVSLSLGITYFFGDLMCPDISRPGGR